MLIIYKFWIIIIIKIKKKEVYILPGFGENLFLHESQDELCNINHLDFVWRPEWLKIRTNTCK